MGVVEAVAVGVLTQIVWDLVDRLVLRRVRRLRRAI